MDIDPPTKDSKPFGKRRTKTSLSNSSKSSEEPKRAGAKGTVRSAPSEPARFRRRGTSATSSLGTTAATSQAPTPGSLSTAPPSEASLSPARPADLGTGRSSLPSQVGAPTKDAVVVEQLEKTGPSADARGQLGEAPAANPGPQLRQLPVSGPGETDKETRPAGRLRGFSLNRAAAVLRPMPTRSFPTAPTVQLEELLREPDGGQPPAVAIAWCRDGLIPAALLALSVSVIVVLMLFLILHPRQPNPPEGGHVCGTPDCNQHAGLLGIRGTNWSCGDFGRFVCAGWKSKTVEFTRTVSAQTAFNWLSSLERTSHRPYDRTSIVYAPVRMIRKCMDATTSDDRAVMSLLALVNTSGLAWPTVGESERWDIANDYSRPLRLVLELPILWALPFWFRVQMTPAKAHLQRDHVFVVTPSTQAPGWYAFQRELSHYEDDYMTYLNFFNDTILKYRPPSKSFAKFLLTSAAVQTRVFEELNSAFSAHPAKPRLLEIRRLPSFAGKLTADEWVTRLRLIYGPNYSIADDDIFLFTNEQLLAAASSIFTSFSAQDIFFHTLWWFIQSMGPLTIHSMHSFLKRLPKGIYFLSVICFDHVAATHNALLAAMNKVTFEHSEQVSIADHLENIRTVTLEKLNSYNVDRKTKQALIGVLENMTTVIWPEDDFGRPGGFQEYYGQPYEGDGRFIDEWIRSRIRFQPRYAGRIGGDDVKAAMVHAFNSDSLASYNPVLNVLSVSPSALTPPLYYRRATAAVIYGGLGYIYARAIFEAVDTITHLLNGGPVILPSDEPETPGFWNVSWCGHPEGGRSVFPHIPALDVAYSAYMRRRNSTSDLPSRASAGIQRRANFLPDVLPLQLLFQPRRYKTF